MLLQLCGGQSNYAVANASVNGPLRLCCVTGAADSNAVHGLVCLNTPFLTAHDDDRMERRRSDPLPSFGSYFFFAAFFRAGVFAVFRFARSAVLER